MNFKANIPYPTIKVEHQNKDLAKELLTLYAGTISEDTTIHKYIFQMLTINNPEIKQILKQIAITEMHHLELLGLLIKELGITPIFASISHNNLNWFNGSFINYEQDYQKMLLNNIQEEEQTIKNYEQILTKTTDPNIIHIIKRIIIDERIHIKIFTKLKEEQK